MNQLVITITNEQFKELKRMLGGGMIHEERINIADKKPEYLKSIHTNTIEAYAMLYKKFGYAEFSSRDKEVNAILTACEINRPPALAFKAMIERSIMGMRKINERFCYYHIIIPPHTNE